MLAKTLISEVIPTLRTSDTGLTALRLMDEYKVSHLPIVNNEDFLGLISEDDIDAVHNQDEPIGNYSLSLMRPFIDQYQHIYDVVALASSEKLSVVPVLSKNNTYIGTILIKDLVDHFANMTAVRNPGGIIVLETNQNDYSLSEIASIVESNDAIILSSYVTSHPDSIKTEVTLKINKINIYPILQTFDRYNYVVLASFTESSYNDDLMDRYKSLMNYLNL